MRLLFSGLCAAGLSAGAAHAEIRLETPRWQAVELTLEARSALARPYAEVDVWAEFRDEHGTTLRRPAFWDGDDHWKVRFAPPDGGKHWTFTTHSDPAEPGLHGVTGEVVVAPEPAANPLLRRGLLRMSQGARNVVHADGTPFLLVADTPWALPFRGTPESVRAYARDRAAKGFNAALLMVVQPDREATGPRDRAAPGSFGVAFEDLPQGHLNELNPEYFRELDALLGILREHGIVPVFSPVFQGFGWKGQGTLGTQADPAEYTRFVRYLVARYGAWPTLWLASADASGRDAIVEPTGETLAAVDAYGQPVGIHYNPFDDSLANWTDDPKQGLHFNRVHQDAPWLDFQWAQTGHHAEHHPEKVAAMWLNEPPKGVANGEPTYENIANMGHAAGWWQGEEAWLNLMHGGTMGVVYGAGGLWNWKLSADEPGWPDWANTPASWRDALAFSGSRYVGFVSRVFAGMPFTGMAPRPDLAGGELLLAVPGEFYVSYLPRGGKVTIDGVPARLHARWFDPQAGTFRDARAFETDGTFTAPTEAPWVLVIGPPTSAVTKPTEPVQGVTPTEPPSDI